MTPTCTWPRHDPKRPVCGRTATVVYIGIDPRHETWFRCDSHDTYAARMWAVDEGIRRVPVRTEVAA